MGARAPDLHPMSMGELLDRSALFWRSSFKPLFKLTLVFQVVLYLLLKAYAVAMATWFPLARGGARTNAALQDNPEEALRQILLTIAGSVGVMLLYFLVSWFAQVAVTRFAMPRMLGQEATISEGLRRMVQRAGTIVGGYVLSLAWAFGVGALSVLPGVALAVFGVAAVDRGPGALALAILGLVLAGLGLLVAGVLFLLRIFLTPQVIAMEDLGALAAFRRSGELVSGRAGPGFFGRVKVRATVVVTVVALILMAAGVVSGLPALVLQLVYGKLFDPANANPDAVPQLLLIPAELLQVLAQAAFGPLGVLCGVLFYLDMRVRREGLDLELELDALEQPRVAA